MWFITLCTIEKIILDKALILQRILHCVAKMKKKSFMFVA